MRYLLDSHVFLWAATAPEKLSPKARRICEQTVKPLILSVASLWESPRSAALANCPSRQPEVTLPGWVARMNMQVLPLEAAHAYALYRLPMLHRIH